MTRSERKLLAVLQDEKLALLSGDYQALAALADKKSTLMKSLGPDTAAIENIDAALRRNHRLTLVAKTALDTVVTRLKTSRKTADDFGSYGRDGTRAAMNNRAPSKLNSSI